MTAQVAETVLRVAVLLEAGVTPTRAWDHLAKQGDLQASQVVNAVDGGARIDSAIAALAVEPAPEPRRRIRIARACRMGMCRGRRRATHGRATLDVAAGACRSP